MFRPPVGGEEQLITSQVFAVPHFIAMIVGVEDGGLGASYALLSPSDPDYIGRVGPSRFTFHEFILTENSVSAPATFSFCSRISWPNAPSSGCVNVSSLSDSMRDISFARLGWGYVQRGLLERL